MFAVVPPQSLIRTNGVGFRCFVATRYMPALLLAVAFSCISAVDATADLAADEPRPIRLMFLQQGPDGHPRASHEYVTGVKLLARSLRDVPRLQVTVVDADDPWIDGPERLTQADGVVLYLAEGAKWTQAEPRRKEAFARFAARGGAIVALHWAIGTKSAEPIAGFQQLLGGCHGGPDRKYQVLETTVGPARPDHPITAGIPEFKIRDEFYYRLKFVESPKAPQPVLTALIDGERHAVAWSWERGDGGRSFGFSGAHFHENWRRDEYLRLVSQAILWTLRIEPPRAGFPATLEDQEFELPPAPTKNVAK